MTEERVAYFTSKITSGSMTGIIVTAYEIFFEYTKEAVSGEKVTRDCIRKASKVLEHLKDALDFTYDISANLFSLYDFCERELARALYKNDVQHVENANKIMKELYESFVEVDRQDSSEAVMKNSQQIKAGMTYGRNDVNEILEESNNRGFLA